jgi:hypothetical protein
MGEEQSKPVPRTPLGPRWVPHRDFFWPIGPAVDLNLAFLASELRVSGVLVAPPRPRFAGNLLGDDRMRSTTTIGDLTQRAEET